MRKLIWVAGLLCLLGCGKSDFYSDGSGYYNQSPYFGAQGPIVPPTGAYPQINPQLPQGYPQQYQPFAPMYNYFQQSPQMSAYYQNLWQQWQVYAQQRQVNVYSFPTFWYQFCPQQVPQQFYTWFNVSVYQQGGYGYCGECF